VRHEILQFRQHDEGLCGLYTVVNALSVLFPERMTQLKGALLVARLAQALPGDFHLIVREGTDRAQMELMLAAAQGWARDLGWTEWTCRAMHPARGMKAQAFWDEVETALSGRHAVAFVGFGDYHAASTYYEPHWTCVERLTPRMIHLRDSDDYTQIPRTETGIRPENGWEIEDCFILERTPAEVAQLEQRQSRSSELLLAA
jgi:hypothetical protein